MKSSKLLRFLWTGFQNWTPLVLAVVLIFSSTYMVFQQYLRLSANDVLVETLKSNHPLTREAVDLTKTLSVFTIFYDSAGRPATGSGFLESSLPTMPSGVFAAVKNQGEDRITWQPRPGLRFATVIVPYKVGTVSGYLLAGRSLSQTENNIDRLTKQVAVSCFTTLVLIFIYTLLVEYLRFK